MYVKIPIVSVFVDVMSEPLFQGLVISFRLFVGLCMVSSYGESLNTNDCTNVFEEFSDKLRSVVCQQCIGDSIGEDPMVKEHRCDVRCFGV